MCTLHGNTLKKKNMCALSILKYYTCNQYSQNYTLVEKISCSTNT